MARDPRSWRDGPAIDPEGARFRRRPQPARWLGSNGWRESVDFVVLLLLLGLCAVGGGSAFADTLSLLHVRPAAVAALVVFALTPAPLDVRTIRMPLILLAGWALLTIVQLVPLPPSLWTALPGRTTYLEAAAAAGLPQPWRPWSIAPDLTANSLVALVVPAAVLIGFAKISKPHRRWLAVTLAGLCVTSAVLGIAQFADGSGSALVLYRRSHDGFPVGLLANRNHQAALLACVFPALRVWTMRPAANAIAARRRSWIAVVFAALIVPVILATGSRAGTAVALASLAVTLLAFPIGQAPAANRPTTSNTSTTVTSWSRNRPGRMEPP